MIAILLATGCTTGDSVPRGQVTGKVLGDDGEPVHGYRIVYTNEETGTAGTGAIGVDGSYEVVHRGVPGLPANLTYIVTVVPAKPKSMTSEQYDAFMDASPREQARIERERQPEMSENVPEEFFNTRTSQLKFVVKEGDQTNDVILSNAE
ncbi:hypothetical protein AB1K70_04795 [Bremerella sp. JC770]|uniref:hypothetical protein n=1 Tax=Bremerella sp. JC770 TaxID=3232137 RepID=UPI003459410B